MLGLLLYQRGPLCCLMLIPLLYLPHLCRLLSHLPRLSLPTPGEVPAHLPNILLQQSKRHAVPELLLVRDELLQLPEQL